MCDLSMYVEQVDVYADKIKILLHYQIMWLIISMKYKANKNSRLFISVYWYLSIYLSETSSYLLPKNTQ